MTARRDKAREIVASDLRGCGQSPLVLPNTSLVRVQCLRKGIFDDVEGPTTRPIVLPMTTEKERDLTKSYDKSLKIHQQSILNSKVITQKRHKKLK